MILAIVNLYVHLNYSYDNPHNQQCGSAVRKITWSNNIVSGALFAAAGADGASVGVGADAGASADVGVIDVGGGGSVAGGATAAPGSKSARYSSRYSRICSIL